jgi:hypothetical protein
MPKDLHLLRDLWYTIDPTCEIGDPTMNLEVAHADEKRRREQARRAKDVVYEKAKALRRTNKQVPKTMAHLLKGYDHPSRTNKPISGQVVRAGRNNSRIDGMF